MLFKIIFAISLLLSRVEGSPNNEFNLSEYLENNSIIYALSLLAQTVDVSQQCRDHLAEFQAHALKKSAWAMKMLDASGQRMSGFLFGQVYWLGDRQICKAVQETVDLLISPRHNRHMHWSILNETAPFDVGFSVAYLEQTSPWHIEVNYYQAVNKIFLGLCTPTACGTDDLTILVKQLLISDLFPVNHFYELNATLFDIKATTGSWLPSSKFFQHPIFICIVCLTCCNLLLMIISAILSRKSSKQKAGHFVAFIQCFNIAENARKIFKMDNGVDTNDVLVINGIRSIVAIVVIFMHMIVFSGVFVTNNDVYLPFVRYGYLIVVNSIIDIFFFLSGFLQAYKFLNNTRRLESMRKSTMCQVFKEFSKRIFHRWLRLAPLYYIVLCLVAHFMMGLSENSLMHMKRYDVAFQTDWWRYLLFTQNYIHDKIIIAGWVWSMGCEMQFFIAGTLLLLLYAKKPAWAKITCLAALVANLLFYLINADYGILADEFMRKRIDLYSNSLIRCTSYIFGMICGWYLSNQKRRLNALAERVIGNSALVVFIILVILFYYSDDVTGGVFFSVLFISRVLISLWIGWLITAAISKRRTWISSFLELSIFGPFARLSYAVYLLHPIVILSLEFMSDTGIHWDPRIMIILFFGHVVTAFFGATLLSLAIELPFCNLSSLILKRKTVERNKHIQVELHEPVKTVIAAQDFKSQEQPEGSLKK